MRWRSTGGDLNAARVDEPYRRAITGIYARLAATYQNVTGTSAAHEPAYGQRASPIPMPRACART